MGSLMKAVRVLALALPSLLVASPAFAEIIDEPPPSAAGDHDSGFLLRLALGLGYESLGISGDNGTDISLGGFGGALEVAIGGVVTPNLSINADLFASTVVNPTVDFNGQEFESDDVSVSLTCLGVGVTYYIMPLNLYLAGSVGLGKASFNFEGDNSDADWGFALNAMIGKEFFVSQDWGIGVAGQLIFADVPTDSDSVSASYLALNIAFTATYN